MMVHPSLGEFNLNSTYLVKYVMPLPLQTTPCHLQRSNDGVSTVWYDPLACDRIRADSSSRSPVRSLLIEQIMDANYYSNLTRAAQSSGSSDNSSYVQHKLRHSSCCSCRVAGYHASITREVTNKKSGGPWHLTTWAWPEFNLMPTFRVLINYVLAQWGPLIVCARLVWLYISCLEKCLYAFQPSSCIGKRKRI